MTRIHKRGLIPRDSGKGVHVRDSIKIEDFI